MFIHVFAQCTDIAAADRSAAAISVHCAYSCIYSHKIAPEGGRVCRPKHVELI